MPGLIFPLSSLLRRLFFAALLGPVLASCNAGSSDDSESTELQNDQSPIILVNNGPARDSGFTIDSIHYSLNAALGDQWGHDDEHFRIDFTVINGNFIIEPAVIDGIEHPLLVPAQSTAVLHLKVFSPGDSLSLGSFAYANNTNSDGSLSGVAYFTDAYVGVDINLDESVDAGEQHTIIDGIVQFTGTFPDIDLEFTVTLSDGQLVAGSYTGLYDFTQRF